MRSPSASPERGPAAPPPPFLLKVFCRTGAFHRPDEFLPDSRLPPHVPIYTSPNCTLTELAHLITAADASVLPSPSIGTRLAYRLIYPDTRPGGASAPRLIAKDLGSVVIGAGGQGAETNTGADDGDVDMDADAGASIHDANRTLADARYVVGDFVSVAVLPPLATGDVAPASSAQTGRGSGPAERGRIRETPGFARGDRENGFGRGRGPRLAASGFGGRERRDDRVPMGEWRRGERLPDAPPRGRGRGRGW